MNHPSNRQKKKPSQIIPVCPTAAESDDGLDRLCVTDVSATQLVYNRPAAVQQMFSEVHFDNRQLLLMRPSRYKTKTMRLQLGDESYSAPSVHQTQQVRIAKGCCHHYKLETKHVSSSIFTNLAVFCSKGGGVSNPCSNIAKGTTDPRVEFIMPK